MITLECNSVTDAYNRLMCLMREVGVRQPSRNGDVMTFNNQVMLHVNYPNERVLLDPARNCNPFFHLMEAIWMLAGSNDVEFVKKYNSNISSYSDDGRVFNAAYGYRWRRHFGYDQITRAGEMLKANKYDRRVLISMWDPANDLGSGSKDIPCNLMMIPKIIRTRSGVETLELTTINRSNDLVWGLCGANAVHLTICHEFLAAMVGLKLGMWHHWTNNLHVYERHFELMKSVVRNPHLVWQSNPKPSPLVADPCQFLAECEALVFQGKDGNFQEPFLEDTVEPVMASWAEFKAGNMDDAIHIAACIESEDWRTACYQWLKRAQKRK